MPLIGTRPFARSINLIQH